MNIYEKHLAEVREAQVDFNEGALKLHDAYAARVQASREGLLHALTGDKTPIVDLGELEKRLLRLPEADDMIVSKVAEIGDSND